MESGMAEGIITLDDAAGLLTEAILATARLEEF